MGRVESVITNDLGETTAAYVYKGGTKEKVYRHVTSLILLVSVDNFNSGKSKDLVAGDSVRSENLRPRSQRKAAILCGKKLKISAGD